MRTPLAIARLLRERVHDPGTFFILVVKPMSSWDDTEQVFRSDWLIFICADFPPQASFVPVSRFIWPCFWTWALGVVTGEALRHAQACSPREDKAPKRKKNLYLSGKIWLFWQSDLNGSPGEQVGAGSFTSCLAELTKIKEEEKKNDGKKRRVCALNASLP